MLAAHIQSAGRSLYILGRSAADVRTYPTRHQFVFPLFAWPCSLDVPASHRSVGRIKPIAFSSSEQTARSATAPLPCCPSFLRIHFWLLPASCELELQKPLSLFLSECIIDAIGGWIAIFSPSDAKKVDMLPPSLSSSNILLALFFGKQLLPVRSQQLFVLNSLPGGSSQPSGRGSC